ncbi:hypothetical protein ACFP81_11075 [Deinococcus lacus]|uniref:Uncharacterized protein n=1 Tax=Deinococcus lacus TaxID=392561 RepID=A0ABW1YG23_9DEIO
MLAALYTLLTLAVAGGCCGCCGGGLALSVPCGFGAWPPRCRCWPR